MTLRSTWLGLAAMTWAVAACERPAPSTASASRPASAAAPVNATRPAPSNAAARPAPSTPRENAPTQDQVARPGAAPSQPREVREDPAFAGIPTAFAEDGTRRTCAQLAPREGYDCVETPNGPVHVLSHNAGEAVDPCATAVCLPGTRCESATMTLGGGAHRLPRCVASRALENVTPTRDPCASHLCPLGYRCTAPADAPYCVPESAGWNEARN